MMLWWMFLVNLVSIGFAQQNCCRKAHIPAPVFGAGDNLSVDGCGVWFPSEKNESAPWVVVVEAPGSRSYGTLISPTSILTVEWGSWLADKFAASANKDGFEARLGKCASSEIDSCKENGQGRVSKFLNFTKLDTPGMRYLVYIWKIERVILKENYIAPICISNKGNVQDSDRRQQYETFLYSWYKYIEPSAKLFEDLSPCLNKSEYSKFKTCDTVHENFLCVQLSTEEVYVLDYLTYQDENQRYYLRALLVEQIQSSHKFYYDLAPLLDQIIAATGDIPLLPKIPKVKNKIDFGAGQSFPGCGTLSLYRRKKRDYSEEEVGIVAFLYGGKNTQRNMQPWHARLTADGKFCGATLVSPNALITAAHCLVDVNGAKTNPSDVEITVGLYNRNDEVDAKQTKIAVHVFVHENYIPKLFDNDVAVVLVASPGFEVSATVRPICLWNHDYDLKHIENSTGKVVGWGFIENSTRPEILQTVNLPVVGYKECFLKRRYFFTQNLKPGQNFCAGGNEATACGGDSGGGFAMQREGRWFLRGVVSSGKVKKFIFDEYGIPIPVCNAKIPSLYTDVTYYMDWIVQKANLQTTISN